MASYEVLSQPLELPCGVTLKNRIFKSCMSDSLGDGMGNPTSAQIRLYERWAQGGVALSCIGEVQIDPRFPEKPGNLVLGEKSKLELLGELAKRGTVDGSHLWPQLGHAGALSHSPIHKPRGPSALTIDGLDCDALTVADIQHIPQEYAKAAKLAKGLGFNGVHIHAGHGFLLSQFLCPLFNKRDDEYGSSSVRSRSRLLLETITAVRNVVGPSFPVGVRINSSDQIEGGLTEDDALEVVRLLDNTSIDIIDVSGGTYFPGAKNASDSESSEGAYFIRFARRAKQTTSKPIILSGGFKKRQDAIEAVASGAADMVGIARGLCLEPDLAKTWMGAESQDPKFPRFASTVPGGITAWFTMRLTALGRDEENSFDLDLADAVKEYDERDAQRIVMWKENFGLP